jgi:hypothetical protein
VFVFDRELVSGVYKPKEGIWVGNVPELSLSMSVTKVDHRESYSGQALVDLSYVTEKNATVNITLEEFSAFNFGLALNGATKKVAAATGNTITYAALNEGKTYVLGGDINVSNVVLEDSTSTALVLNTDYTLDAMRGSFTMLTTQTGGGTVTYDTGGYDLTSLYTLPDSEWWLRFEGLNMLDNNRPTVADFYRVKFEPAQNLGFISNEIAQFPITATPLADDTQPASGDLGQFGSIKILRSAA